MYNCQFCFPVYCELVYKETMSSTILIYDGAQNPWSLGILKPIRILPYVYYILFCMGPWTLFGVTNTILCFA